MGHKQDIRKGGGMEDRMSLDELRIYVGNMAFRLWSKLPEPKLRYVEWYYRKRSQSLSETLEGHAKGEE